MNYMDNVPVIEITQDEYKALIKQQQKYELLIDNLYRRAKVYKGFQDEYKMTIDNAEEVLILLDFERFTAKLSVLIELEKEKGEGNERKVNAEGKDHQVHEGLRQHNTQRCLYGSWDGKFHGKDVRTP